MPRPPTLKLLSAGDARATVFVLPAAGAGPASLRSWRHGAPAGIEVLAIHTPGREERLRDEPYRHVDALAPAVAEVVREHLTGRPGHPYAIVGHSMGALVGRQALADLGDRPPRVLVAAAALPPDRVPDYRGLSDADLVDLLTGWGGTPAALLADPEVYSIFLPALRADLEVVASARRDADDDERADVPILVLCGQDDQWVVPAAASGWAAWTRSWTRQVVLGGGHFFPAADGPAVLDLVVAHLDPEPPAAAGR